MPKTVKINGETVTPINKVKLWQLEGWSPAKIKRMLIEAQKEARAKQVKEASK